LVSWTFFSVVITVSDFRVFESIFFFF
jgi:hypothetical protein